MSQSDDLDAFLTALESKLRGPFSSLDLAKAVTASSLADSQDGVNGGITYLHHVLDVLPRAEKVTQLRCLVGLLALEASSSDATTNDSSSNDTIDQAMQSIAQAAQEDPVYEEWVRIIAGLVERILFDARGNQSDDTATTDMDTTDASDAIPMGAEAKNLLEKTCTEILDRVRKLERTTSVIDEDSEHLLAQSDADPLVLAPYRYALLHPDWLERVIPQVNEPHHHFNVNADADILSMDSKLELEKAREEQEHQQTGLMAATKQSPSTAIKDPHTLSFPGVRSNTSAKPAPIQRPKSSMFLPSKKPSSLLPKRPLPGARTATTAGGLKPAVQPVLHQRKAGAAQALLAKGRARARLQTDTAGTATTALVRPTTLPGTATVSGVKSKLKLIDVTEVQGLETKKLDHDAAHTAPAAKVARGGRKAITLSGHKRKETSTDKVSRLKTHTETKQPRTHGDAHKPAAVAAAQSRAASAAALLDGPGAMAAAALLAYQSQQGQIDPRGPLHTLQSPTHESAALDDGGNATAHSDAHHASKQQDWRSMLQLTSNKLTDDDRLRVQQFFVQHYNPTPAQPLYKMKLHEVRTTDPKTGTVVKETYYLELDYTNFTSKQNKKVKRY